jgi:AraC family transcriptional regulator, alkane utilization regulator
MTQTPDLLTETPFFDDAAPGPSGIDVLSDILRVFHVTGAALLRGEFGAPWAWHAPPSSEIAKLLHPGATQLIIFHIVAEGSCWVEVDGEERRMLRSGDIVGFPHGHAHSMGSGEAELIPIASLFPSPPWMKLPDQGPPGQWFDANMRYLASEAVRARPGTSCMMARLTELLFIEMLRLQMAQLCEEDVGWLAALNDRYTSCALNCFTAGPPTGGRSRPWPVKSGCRAPRWCGASIGC